jgi:hypothetical protein
MPFAEAEKYRAQLDEAIETAGNGWDGTFAMMRHTAVYETSQDRGRSYGCHSQCFGQIWQF